MLAKDLYAKLDNDFIKPGLSDEWFKYMPELEHYLCDNFKNRNMGLVCDFTETVNRVFTAVFPSERVIKNISLNNENAMLFVHHASNWDLNKSPVGFYNMTTSMLEMLKEKRISIYCLHSPLDNYGEFSTSKTFADALDIEFIKTFIKYEGGLCGVIGRTKHKTITELQKQFTQVVGHKTKLYQYGEPSIDDGIVGLCAGGGNQVFVIEELLENNIKTLITGLTVKNDFSAEAHRLGEKHGINIIGGTHYSTEKFACIAMCEYFERNGLLAEFIEDVPCLEDL